MSNLVDLQGENLIFIGDVHGQYKKLTTLLTHLNFDISDANSQVATAKLVFVGDLIDNSFENNPDHIATLTLVKLLVDKGIAYCIMGNHELNAIAWATPSTTKGEWLRPHSDNNLKQHAAFLEEVTEGSFVHQEWIHWFKTLPLYLDFGFVRCIHAYWNTNYIEQLQQYINADNSLNDQYWSQTFDKSHELYQLTETLLKGPEIALPEGYSFFDKMRTERTNFRVRWWLDNEKIHQDIAKMGPKSVNCIHHIELPDVCNNQAQDVPVVIGHYTLAEKLAPLSEKVVCVDYNAAKGSNPLVAYFFENSEGVLDKNNFSCLNVV